MALTFDDASGRFRTTNGQFISEAAVRSVIDAIADGASARMDDAATRMLAGNLSLAEWQAEMMRTIKLSQVAASTIARGGAARMGFSEYGAAGREIRTQYDFLRAFAQQVADGSQPLNGSLIARARQYGQSARTTFSRAYDRDQRQRGFVAVKNILGAAEHCQECRSLAARGWMPLAAMPPIGSRQCRANDRCRLAYSRSAEVAA